MEKPKQIIELEKIIGIELKQVDKVGLATVGFSMDGNKIDGLGLYDCSLKEIGFLDKFTDLTNLSLRNNQIQDISSIHGLKDLNILGLSHNQVQDISVIQNLKHLNELSISSNLIQDISPLQHLTNLKELNISKNDITDISAVHELIDLIYLNVTNNKIFDLSPLINKYGFKFLTDLYLWKNQIKDISPLKDLLSLKFLGLSNNNISDILPLANLLNLSDLNLGANEIEDISPLKNLKKLNRLDLRNLPLQNLPEWITEFPNMEIKWINDWDYNSISFYRNPIKTPPLEILKEGKEAIRNYFEQLKKEKGQRYLFEAKLLILGEGGVGKTSFAGKIKDSKAELPKENETTLGIDVSNWNFTIQHPSLGEKTLFTNIWDFGGQKLYQGTHQMFFSDKSFYVLIDDTREEKTDFSYWLNTIAQLASNGSKVLIVTNKKHSHVPQIDKNGLLGHFGDLIAGFIEIDLKNDTEDIVKLQNMVKLYLQNLPEIGSPLPASWVSIREDLFHENKNFISYDRYLEICKKNKTDLASVNFLSEYFNRVGVFTHYYNDDLLRERVYLNSNWLVNTIYQVLNHQIVKDKKGRLTEMDVKKIWNGTELFNETSKLTRLMHQFGLMYEIPDKKEFVVPAHLQSNQPYSKWPYLYNNEVLDFVYEFDKYMPKGIMSQLIVALHRYITKHEMVWQKGVNINYNNTVAEITETYDKSNKYIIRLMGNEKKELLGIINSKFDEILAPFLNLQYEKLVPCNCSICKLLPEPHFYKYAELHGIIERGKRDYLLCSKSDEEVKIKQLLDAVFIEIESIVYDREYQLYDLLRSKLFYFEKELITTFDAEKKFALLEKIKDLEKQIKELKQKM